MAKATLTSRYVPFVLVAMLLPFSASAQMAGGASALAEKAAENSRKLKQCAYKQTVQVFFKGELRKTQVSQVHYDSTGKKISVPLESPSEQQQAPELGRRRLGGRIIERKIEEKKDEMKEYVERLVGLMGQYLPPNPERLKAAVPNAHLDMSESGDARFAMKDFLKPGDLMTLAVDPANKQLNQIIVNSTLDQDPVSFVVNFSRLKDGTSYPSLTTAKSPARELELRVTTSDYYRYQP